MSDTYTTAPYPSASAAALPEPMRRELAFVLDHAELASGFARKSTRLPGFLKSAKVAAPMGLGVLAICTASLALLPDMRIPWPSDDRRREPIRQDVGRVASIDRSSRHRELVLPNGFESAAIETSRPKGVDTPRPDTGSRGDDTGAMTSQTAQAARTVEPSSVAGPDRRTSMAKIPSPVSQRPFIIEPSQPMIADVPSRSDFSGRAASTITVGGSDQAERWSERHPDVAVEAGSTAAKSKAAARRDGADAIFDLRRQW